MNAANPGTHFMSTTVYDAREAMVPGSIYDRTGTTNTAHPHYMPRPGPGKSFALHLSLM